MDPSCMLDGNVTLHRCQLMTHADILPFCISIARESVRQCFLHSAGCAGGDWRCRLLQTRLCDLVTLNVAMTELRKWEGRPFS